MTSTLPPLFQAVFWAIILGALVLAAWWVNRASVQGSDLETDRADLNVYADQVREIDRELSQGRIAQDQAEASKLEIGRRLVKARDRVLTQGPRLNRVTLGVIAAAIALLGGGLYLVSGSPGKSDLPFAARERELLSRDPATLTENEILVLLQERARLNPRDPVPHALLGQVLAAAGRDQEALRAFQAVIRRAPNDAEAIAEAGGVLMRLNSDKAGDDARAAFAAALKLNPNSPAANFYVGLIAWQEGKRDEGQETWARAYNALGANPDGQSLIATRAAQIMSALDRGPQTNGQADAGGMAKMSGADQAAFVGSMVEMRKARLSSNPQDVALRLSVVRVLLMSQQYEEARRILLEGAQRGDNTPFSIALYGVAARGLPQPDAAVTKR